MYILPQLKKKRKDWGGTHQSPDEFCAQTATQVSSNFFDCNGTE